MKIGFDISQTGKEKAGCGYFAYSLLRALAEVDDRNKYLLYSSFGPYFWDPTCSSKCPGINHPNFVDGIKHDSLLKAQQFWNHPSEDFEKRLGMPDIVHSNNFYCPTGLRQSKFVYTLHDLGFIKHPELTTELNRVTCFEGAFNASLQAAAIISVSNYSKQHFLQVFPHYPAENIHVVHLASRFQDFTRLPRPTELRGEIAPEQFWLSVGTIEPRKNHRSLLEAYAMLKQETGTTMPLVHAGGAGWLMEDFQELIRKLGLSEDVFLLGYVNDATLQWLYQNCFAFVYPSFFEGFGLPVLEAMSQGAAVISSNTTSIPEIVKDAGILVDPGDVHMIYSAMRKLLLGEIGLPGLKTSALQRSAQFSWQISAKKVLDVYQRISEL